MYKPKKKRINNGYVISISNKIKKKEPIGLILSGKIHGLCSTETTQSVRPNVKFQTGQQQINVMGVWFKMPHRAERSGLSRCGINRK